MQPPPLPSSNTNRDVPPAAGEAGLRVLKRAFFVLVVMMVASLLLIDTRLDSIRPRSIRVSDCNKNPSGYSPLPIQQRDHLAHTALLQLGDTTDGPVFPEAIYDIDWAAYVPRADVIHMGQLERVCMDNKDSLILWSYSSPENASTTVFHKPRDSDPHEQRRVLQALRQCADVDIYVPPTIRKHGYCEDAAAYAKYVHGRILPRWVLEMQFVDAAENRVVRYHDLCPRTPMLFFNHYWDAARADPSWPPMKPLYLMPNIEMYELEARHFAQADVVLCKTAVCAQHVAKWFAQEGNPKMTQVLYTRFTTSDVATDARIAAGIEDMNAQRVRQKNYAKPVFLHTAGTSMQKGTAAVLDCWLSRADLPVLDLYIAQDTFEGWYSSRYRERITKSANVKLHTAELDSATFGSLVANASFFLCTSLMEGYGHYINQARASGGVILTPDVPPMNELVSSVSGILVSASRFSHWQQFLGGQSKHSQGLHDTPGFVAQFGGDEVCAAVDRLLNVVTVRERQQLATRAQQQYFYDTAFFAVKMEELRMRFLRPALQSNQH